MLAKEIVLTYLIPFTLLHATEISVRPSTARVDNLQSMASTKAD